MIFWGNPRIAIINTSSLIYWSVVSNILLRNNRDTLTVSCTVLLTDTGRTITETVLKSIIYLLEIPCNLWKFHVFWKELIVVTTKVLVYRTFSKVLRTKIGQEWARANAEYTRANYLSCENRLYLWIPPEISHSLNKKHSKDPFSLRTPVVVCSSRSLCVNGITTLQNCHTPQSPMTLFKTDRTGPDLDDWDGPPPNI